MTDGIGFNGIFFLKKVFKTKYADKMSAFQLVF